MDVRLSEKVCKEVTLRQSSFYISNINIEYFVSFLHLSSLVVLTSSATLLMELMKVLRSELWTSQRTKYSNSAVPSRDFRLSLVSRW